MAETNDPGPKAGPADKVAIIGAGLIGRSWAMVFARSGWQVSMHDPSEGTAYAALSACRSGLENLAAYGLCADAEAAFSRISTAPDLTAAVEGARHIQENAPEQLAIKREVFAALDAAAHPDAVIASSTSGFRCSLLSDGLAGRHRCIVAHPANPPHLLPVVEIAPAPWTAGSVVETTRATFEGIGSAPVSIRKEIDGFILNRLQAALLTEAFRLVAEGYVSPQDLDKTISDGLGLRWSFLGPFQAIELNAPGGVPDYCARYGHLLGQVASEMTGAEAWSDEAMARVVSAWGPAKPAEDHARLTAERDRRLAALAAHKATQNES